MPILLNNLQNAVSQPVKIYVPKFFDTKLTGRGGTSTGVLSIKNNPISIDPKICTNPSDKDTRRKVGRSGQTTTNKIPMNPLTVDAWNYMDDLNRPNPQDLVMIGTSKSAKLYLKMDVQTITMEETVIPDRWGGPSTTQKEFRANYICTFFTVVNQTKMVHRRQSSIRSLTTAHNDYCIVYTTNPVQELQYDVVADLKSAGWKIDSLALQNYLSNYDLYDAVCARSEQWQTNIGDILG